MDDPHDRSDRFELLAACDGEALAGFADEVLAPDPGLAVLQEPRPQLLMQQVQEPVERRPFNLGEVVVTPAEVRLENARGFAMRPGKDERGALSGAIVDAAVAAGHPVTGEVVDRLHRVRERRQERRREAHNESRHTTVEFETMEEDL
jgi:alpha-D-ribose 1-methylphosphonate 5-triphosphate synthase subunit PhnG